MFFRSRSIEAEPLTWGQALQTAADQRSPGMASRREFLKRASALSVAGAATPLALNLAAIGEAAAQSNPSDYKALVCVFLYGGNDWANTLIPYDDAGYAQYAALRAGVSIDRNLLAGSVLNPITPTGGRQYALAPGLTPLAAAFNAGYATILPNVGTLIEPTTKQQYQNRSVDLPPKLFSHNDQQSFAQSSAPEGAISGWGGRIGDVFASSNGNSTFTCISVSGNAVYLTGRAAVQYQVTTSGPVAINGIRNPLFGSRGASDALRALMTNDSGQLMENEYATITRRAVDAFDLVQNAVTPITLATPFPAGNNLADQLRMVARLIAARNSIGVRRQVFFVSMGGFDNHDSLLTQHTGLLARVGAALGAFNQATVELGVANQVTTFTGTDFGRTLTGNNNGSDHGWGGVQMVMGGAVQGRTFTGALPVLANNGPDDVGQGRLLPNLSVDQMGATLAKWFGVSDTNMAMVMPNLANFTAKDLGFMG
jgi:uncharacterized protein (DUF1501 family)